MNAVMANASISTYIPERTSQASRATDCVHYAVRIGLLSLYRVLRLLRFRRSLLHVNPAFIVIRCGFSVTVNSRLLSQEGSLIKLTVANTRISRVSRHPRRVSCRQWVIAY